jgi:hypothetical protein
MLFAGVKIKYGNAGEFATFVFCKTEAEAAALKEYFKINLKGDVNFKPAPFEIEETNNGAKK